jgi:hypothetical protein
MNKSRTYLFVRLWERLSPSFPATAFNEVPDKELNKTLAHLGARWLREVTEEEQDADTSRIESITADLAGLIPELLPSELEAVGIAFHSGMIGKPDCLVPKWIVFHAEDSVENARHLLASLPNRVASPHAISLRIVERRSFTPETWLGLERELEQFEATHSLKLYYAPSARDEPLYRLREEALELSKDLRGRATPASPSDRRDAIDRNVVQVAPEDSAEAFPSPSAETEGEGEEVGLTRSRGQHRPRAPEGWIWVADAISKYKVPRSTLQGWIDKFSEADMCKNKDLNLVRIRESTLREALRSRGRLA